MPESEPQEKPKKAKVKKPPKFHRDIAEHIAASGGLKADEKSPFCLKCGLNVCGSRKPYLEFHGSKDPLITVIFDAVGRKEDAADEIACAGSQNNLLLQRMERFSKELGFDMSRVRVISTTRCANFEPQKINYATKGNWCRVFAVEDLRKYPPRLVMPVGTVALGLLSHKSNAQDWAGRLLNWRGYPDDWLTDARYADNGHPSMPLPTEADRRPMLPILVPRLVFMTQNPVEIRRWEKTIKLGMQLALDGVKPQNYDRPWFRLLRTAEEVAVALKAIPDGTTCSYDLETAGLLPFGPRAAIVFVMFRYDLPDGTKVAFGFPWQYPESPLVNDVAALGPLLLETLYRVKLRGHNIAFDAVYTFATIPGASIERITNSIIGDTRHMAYALRQSNQSLGLELLAYDWAPDMAGYEEEFVLLKDRYPELLDPGTNPEAHYARCPADKWETHLKPYVMGDVEVVHQAAPKIDERLRGAKRYEIPLSDPNRLGHFRKFKTPGRHFVYNRLMLPASRTLTRIQARGMFVDQAELSVQEDLFPKMIRAAREEMRKVDPRVIAWCEQMEATEPRWTLDLESRAQLKTIFFDILRMPVRRLTSAGEKLFPEDLSSYPYEQLTEYAAIDKFTVMNMVAEHPNLKPFQEYRKLHKAYTTYVRSMRNIMAEGVDKKERTKDPYLMRDSCVHPTYNQAGTRGGRLSSASPNAQQISRDSIVKRLYTSRFGKTGLIAQYDASQIELRLLAAGCGDPTMVKAYHDNIDLHSLTTSRVFNVPYEHFEKTYMAWLQEKGREKEAKELDRKRKIGKCVDPDTIVEINGQLTRISSVHAGREPDTFYSVPDVYTRRHDGVAKVNRFYCNGEAERLLVVSRHGIVACTAAHPFRLADGSLKRAEDLKQGDTLAPVTPMGDAYHLGRLEKPDPIVAINPFGVEPASCQAFSMTIDENWAHLLGLFYGDGCSSAGEISIATGGKPEYFAWQDRIASSAAKAGLSPKICRTLWDSDVTGPDLIKSGPHAGKLRYGSAGKVILGSTRVSDIFVQLGAVDLERRRTLKIPDWLLNAGIRTKVEFIAGVYDTDGSVVRDGTLSMVTKSWVFAQDLTVLMRSIGMHYTTEAIWNKTYKKHYYRINIPVRHGWEFLRGKLWLKSKSERIKKPAHVFRERENSVRLVKSIGPGQVFDLNVDHPDHLFCCSGLTCRNTTNFLTGYGGGAFGLQSSLAEQGVYLPLEECERIVEALFDTYPGLRKHIGLYKRFILDNGCAVSITGRVRAFEDAFSDDGARVSKALRSGFNHLIQPTASDMILCAGTVVENLMRQRSLESILISTVHDSLIIDAKREEMEAVHEICDGVMNNIPSVMEMVLGDDPEFDSSWLHVVPFAGDGEVGKNYLEALKIVPDKVTGKVDWDRLFHQIDKVA